MKLKDHRQRLMATLDAIRQAVPEGYHPEIEPHLREILAADKEVRGELRDLPAQAEAAKSEAASLRLELKRLADDSSHELAELAAQLQAERQRGRREPQLAAQLAEAEAEISRLRTEASWIRADLRRQAEELGLAKGEIASLNSRLQYKWNDRKQEQTKPIMAQVRDLQNSMMQAMSEPRTDMRLNSQVAVGILELAASQFTNIALWSGAPAANQRKDELLLRICETVNAHMKQLGAHFQIGLQRC